MERQYYSETPVHQWFRAEIEHIEDALRSTRRCIVSRPAGRAFDPFDYDKSFRTLSEMPLCESWDLINIPEGFFPLEGEVVYTHNGITYKEGHIYVVNGREDILCITSGQFEATKEIVKPGERIARLLRQNPTLFTVDAESGIALLYGKRETIAQTLGLFYE